MTSTLQRHSTISGLVRALAVLALLVGAGSLWAAPVSGQGSWETTLQGRLPATPGGTDFQAYYDTLLDVTWVADTSLPVTQSFGLPVSPVGVQNPPAGGIGWTGRMNYPTAIEWISRLNDAQWLGAGDWRLPTVAPVNGSSFVDCPTPPPPPPGVTTDPGQGLCFAGVNDRGYNVGAPGTPYAGSTQSELGHMFYVTLGNLAFFDTDGWAGPDGLGQPGWGLSNTGPFKSGTAIGQLDMLPDIFWTGTDYEFNDALIWYFGMATGGHSYRQKDRDQRVWALRDGDIALIPVPAAAWLFGSAAIMLGCLRRRRGS